MAFEYRKLARSGGDPAALRRNTTAPSFAEACERAIEVRAPSWKDGGKSTNNWRSTLGRFAYPRLADRSVAEITSEDVLAVVLPVWQKPPSPTPRGTGPQRSRHCSRDRAGLRRVGRHEARLRVPRPHRGPQRRSPRRPLARDRPQRQTLDRPRRARQEQPPPPRPPLSAGTRHPESGTNAPRQLRTHLPQPHRTRTLRLHTQQTRPRKRHQRRPPRLPQQLPRLVRRNRRRPRSRRRMPRTHRHQPPEPPTPDPTSSPDAPKSWRTGANTSQPETNTHARRTRTPSHDSSSTQHVPDQETPTPTRISVGTRSVPLRELRVNPFRNERRGHCRRPVVQASSAATRRATATMRHSAVMQDS